MTKLSWPVLDVAETDEVLTKPGAAFAMTQVVVGGYPVRAYERAPATLAEIFERALEWEDREAVVYRDARVTFGALYRAATNLAKVLIEDFGIGKGDRVAIAMRNMPEWIVCFWAIVASGRTVVPLNAWWREDELWFAIEDSGASLVIADQQRAEILGSRLDANAVPWLVAGSGPQEPRSLSALIGTSSDWPTLPPQTIPGEDIKPDDLATIFYTSGTTGKPKGAVGTHRNVATNLINLRVRFARSAVRRGDAVPPELPQSPKTTLLPTPLFHVTGTHSGIVPAMWAGNRIVMMHKWNLEEALSLVERERVNAIVTVPTMSWQIIKCDRLSQFDLSSLETISFGGAPGGAGLVESLKAKFPTLQFANGYGLTETSSLLASNCAEDLLHRPESAGRIMPCNDARIVGDDDVDVPAGERGELLVRGPNVISGYWGRLRETDPAFLGAWFRTGDIACFDRDGFLFILDRKKDVIIRGGENIYCAEIEDILQTVPAIAEAALVGVPHPELGEEAAAFIVVRDGLSLDAAEVRQMLASKVASFKVPKHVILCDEPLPRNDAGKVLKAALREKAKFLDQG